MEKTIKNLSWVVMIAMAIVYVVAQAAAFTHMHAWSMEHLPDETSTWFGWANAVISEIIPTVGMILLFIAEAKAKGKAWAIGLLIFGLFLSGNAQLAEAKNLSYSALFVALLPAVAAAVLLKVAFGLMDLLGIAAEEAEQPAQVLGQPAQVTHLSNLSTPAQEMVHHPAQGAARTEIPTVASTPEQVNRAGLLADEQPGDARKETAAQGPSIPAEQVSQIRDEQAAHDEPSTPAQRKPRAPRRAAQKSPASTPARDPEQLARAVDAVRRNELSQVKAAEQFGVSRAAIQRAMRDEQIEIEAVDERAMSADEFDAELAKLLDSPNET